MSAWPGGACPNCGEDMPARLVHCQVCRALLNGELNEDLIEIPEFQPLQEISAMLDAIPAGYFLTCHHCSRELRINEKYMGQKALCKFCDGPLELGVEQAIAFFANCPHCEKEMKNSMKYAGKRVACNFCEGHIHFNLQEQPR